MVFQNIRFATKQLFSHFFTNVLILSFVFILTLLSFRTLILIPVGLLISQSVLIQITEKGKIDFKTTLSDLDLSLERYFQVLIATIIVVITVIAGFSFFFIPGLIAFYTFQPVLYLLTKNSKLKANESLAQAYKMMKGNRFKVWSYDLVGLVVPVLLFIITIVVIRRTGIIDLNEIRTLYSGMHLMPLRPRFNLQLVNLGIILMVIGLINNLWLTIIYIAKIKFFNSLIKRSAN